MTACESANGLSNLITPTVAVVMGGLTLDRADLQVAGGRAAAMELTGNAHLRFLHCLPAFHNIATAVGKEMYKEYGIEAMEVTDDVFESRVSIVFEAAEDRLHTIKAIIVAMLGE